VPQAGAQAPSGSNANRPNVADDELLVKFRRGTPAAAQAALHQSANARVTRDIAGLDVKVVNVGRGQAQRRLAEYRQNPNVELVELNGIAYPDWTPSDAQYAQQWNLNNIDSTRTLDADIDAPQAWNRARGVNRSRVPTTIAIVDTGIRADHPDLAGKVVDSHNWFVDGGSTNDVFGHGTHVSGIAAADTNNAVGIAGVCPNCKLLNAKVCDDTGGCPYDRIANGVLWSVGCEWRDTSDNCLSPVRAKSINISLSGTEDSAVLQSAIDKAWARGAVLACAAGNDGQDVPHYPAAYPNCIATAATDKSDQKASFSNYGATWVDVAAPGVGILSTVVSGGYAAWNGTSMAAPHVAGLAGLLVGQGYGRDQVRSRIESKTDPVAGSGSFWATGRINACRSVGSTGC